MTTAIDTSLDPEQREYAETVSRSGETLLVVINDILDFSKIEAGEVRLEKLSFDLCSTVEDVTHLLAERAQSKGLELISFVESDVPPVVKGDPFRVRQVLTNLLGNAIKFTEEGEVVLRTSLAEENNGESLVRFEVSDTGIGMTEDQQSRLFRSFSQADTSTTRKYGGTGLGLAISKQLVELMGGEIGVHSEPGQGSVFSFTVPLEKQPEEAPAAPSRLANLRSLHALIVDDNDTNRRLLRKQTSSWGIRNESVESGPRALETLRSAAQGGDPYDLAILDMQMPGMDGLQLARRIKADPTVSSIRLVLLTSMGQRADGEEARQSGIEAYLTKPVKQFELYNCLATVMGTKTTALEEQPVTRHSSHESRSASEGHVLLAEDNPVNQKVAMLMLEKLGYKVDVAFNGLEALEASSRVPYDAILMDVQMPTMDGYQATKEIRHRENECGSERHVPIIATTANAMKGDREKAIETGMDDYVSKPAKSEKLDEVLRRWIKRETPGPSLPVSDNTSAKKEESVDPVDFRVIEGLRELQNEGEPDLLTELVEMFLSDVSSRLASLREAVETEDAQAVEQIAHALKGSCGNMGASRMAELCAELQDVGASGDLSRAPGLLEGTEAEFDRVRPVLEAETAGS